MLDKLCTYHNIKLAYGTRSINYRSRPVAGDIMYQQMTNSVEITVRPFYLGEQSEPDKNHYVWGYHVTIHNHSGLTVQLLNRYWRITDGIGQVQEVRVLGWLANSRFWRREKVSNIPAAVRFQLRRALWLAFMKWKWTVASVLRRRFQRFRWMTLISK